MKIVILLKSGPRTDESARALRTAEDMLAQGHGVSLYLLQEAVRFCQPPTGSSNPAKLRDLIAKNLEVNALNADAEMRGVEISAAGLKISGGSYESLVDLMTSCDRVVGVL